MCFFRLMPGIVLFIPVLPEISFLPGIAVLPGISVLTGIAVLPGISVLTGIAVLPGILAWDWSLFTVLPGINMTDL
ncbi:hypothetical protein AS29_013465 [Bacillus sp. SJS]|nr:hypothetical protein AS29_013465 [Bacillus sp. SJS]